MRLICPECSDLERNIRQNRFISYRTGPLTLIFKNISVSGTAIYEVRIWH